MTKTKIRLNELIMYSLIYIAASVTILLVFGCISYVLIKGFSVVNFEFLTSVSSILNGTTGIAGNIINTLYIIVITLTIVIPIGIGTAIYLNEYAKPGKLVQIIEFTIQTLAGIPSIIYGMFGMIFFGVTLGLGYSILTGSLTLTMMILPLITKNTQEALQVVPKSYRHGSLGLGATKWYMIRTILIPSAMPGITTGIILALGRIVGESAALLFTAGSGFLLPRSGQWLTKVFDSGGTLTVQLYLSMSKGQYDIAFGIAFVLIIIVLIINFISKVIANKMDVTKRK